MIDETTAVAPRATGLGYGTVVDSAATAAARLRSGDGGNRHVGGTRHRGR